MKRRPISAALPIIFAVLGCATSEPTNTRASARSSEAIIGGSPAPTNTWNAVVNVEYVLSTTEPWWCAGVLVSRTYVVTAAHCLPIADAGFESRYTVVAGRHDITTNTGEQRSVRRMIVHPGYDEITKDNDLALLELNTPVSFTPSRTVSHGQMFANIPMGTHVRVLGWGNTTATGNPSPTLRQVDLPLIGVGAACNAAAPNLVHELTQNQICIGNLQGGQDACNGDSGGPAYVLRNDEWFLLGIVSGGDEGTCAQAGRPGIYTYMPNYLDWVQDMVPDAPPPAIIPETLFNHAVLGPLLFL